MRCAPHKSPARKCPLTQLNIKLDNTVWKDSMYHIVELFMACCVLLVTMQSKPDFSLIMHENARNDIGFEQILSSFIQQQNIDFLVIDDAENIVGSTSSISSLLGYAPAELLGHSIDTVAEKGDTAGLITAPPSDTTSTNPVFSQTLRHTDGTAIDVWVHAHELDYDGRTLTSWALYPRKEDVGDAHRLNRYETILDTVGDGIYELDIEGNFVAVNDVIPAVTGYCREELIGENVSLLLDEEDISRSIAVIQELISDPNKEVGVVELTINSSDGGTIPVEDRIALYQSDGEIRGTVGIVRDISDRITRLKALERQRNELLELNRINDVIRDLNQALVTATTKNDIYEAVCERLVQSDSYVIAWIGRSIDADSQLNPLAVVGIRKNDLALLSELEGASTADSSSVQMIQDVQQDGTVSELQEIAAKYEFQSTATIPIRYGSFVYGFLHLYADRELGFTDRERDILNELGETIGLAINAIETRKMLQADSLVELEFSITGENPFIAVCNQYSCTLRLKDALPGKDNSAIIYISIDQATPASILTALNGEKSIRDSRILHAMKDGGLIMLVLTDDTVIGALLAAGARIQQATMSDSTVQLVVHVSHDADIASIVNTVNRYSESPALVSQRDITRPIQSSREYRMTIIDDLTDKQRTTLQAAYQADYFERPRPVAGTTLAENLGISASTFHHHLQAALAKTVGALFSDEIRQQS